MQTRRKDTRMIRKAMYRLKRDYGFPIRLYKITAVTKNLENGTKSRTVKYKDIARVVFVSARQMQQFVYDLSYIAVAKNFTSGGFFETNDRIILIDWQDTRDFEIKPDDYIVYEGKQYLITEVRMFEHEAGYLVKVRGVTGSELVDAVVLESAISVTQTAAGEVV